LDFQPVGFPPQKNLPGGCNFLPNCIRFFLAQPPAGNRWLTLINGCVTPETVFNPEGGVLSLSKQMA
jgi:hypothetical protein